MFNAYYLLWDQCKDAMQAKIKVTAKFVERRTKFDAITLFKAIRTSINKFESTRYKYASLQRAYTKYFLFKQMKATNSDYLEGAQDHYQLIEDHGDTIGPVEDETLTKEELRSMEPVDATLQNQDEIDTAEAQQKTQAKQRIHDKFLVDGFILNADKKHYGKLIKDQENGYIASRNKWPEDLQSAYTCRGFHSPICQFFKVR